MKKKATIKNKVSEIYAWLDERLADRPQKCAACGQCCDFESFGHRLFITSPEIINFSRNIDILPMTTGICPYRKNNKCTVYQYRFAGCRIFSCTADEKLQSDLSNEVSQKFKSLCQDGSIPYTYTDLANALNNHPIFKE